MLAAIQASAKVSIALWKSMVRATEGHFESRLFAPIFIDRADDDPIYSLEWVLLIIDILCSVLREKCKIYFMVPIDYSPY